LPQNTFGYIILFIIVMVTNDSSFSSQFELYSLELYRALKKQMFDKTSLVKPYSLSA